MWTLIATINDSSKNARVDVKKKEFFIFSEIFNHRRSPANPTNKEGHTIVEVDSKSCSELLGLFWMDARRGWVCRTGYSAPLLFLPLNFQPLQPHVIIIVQANGLIFKFRAHFFMYDIC